VPPGGQYTHIWVVPERAGPGPGDSSSVAWPYHSHVDEPADTNAGLIGVIVIARRGAGDTNGRAKDIDREFVSLFTAFDENSSILFEANLARCQGGHNNGQFVAIAGYEWTSQPKYWHRHANGPSEQLFPGSPRYYSHKNVYFLKPTDYVFSAKDAESMTPDLLAAAVQQAGGLIHNAHPSAELDGRDQFDYEARWDSVIANTEMLADTIHYKGQTYPVRGEETVRAFLNRGRKTGFVAGSDTHEGKPSARTAVLATALTRAALFDALRHRRNYALSHARIELDFKINGHWMGETISVTTPPCVVVSVQGTTNLAEVVVIRSGVVCHQVTDGGREVQFAWEDTAFSGAHYYYVRVTQADEDEHGNPSRAWSSPIWVQRRAN